MSTEDRIRDALHEQADPIEPTPGSWERIAARLDRKPRATRPRRLAIAAAVLALIVAVGGALVLRDDGGGSSRVRVGAGTDGEELVAAVRGDGLVLLDPATGTEVRTLGRFPGLREPAASPDGRWIYFVRDAGAVCAGKPIPEIARVARDGGRAQTLVGASLSPLVSPDGSLLAFTGAVDCSDAGGRLVVRSTAGAEAGHDLSDITLGTDTTSAELLSWSPDGSRILLRVTEGTDDPNLMTVDLRKPTAPPTPVLAGLPAITATFVADGSLAVVEPARLPAAVGGPSRVLSIPLQGGPEQRWFDSETAIVALHVSGGDDQVLAVGPRDDHAGGAGFVLQRWRRGDDSPAQIGTGITAAVALPAVSGADASIGSVAAPSVVAARGRMQVVTIDERGYDTGSVGVFPQVSSLAAAPDGRSVFVSYTADSGGCAGAGGSAQPELDRVTLATGARERVVGGATTPVVSPDGRFVAYAMVCDGLSLGVTNLRTGESYRTDYLPNPSEKVTPTAVEPLGFSPDSRRLLYRVAVAGEAEPRYYAGCLWPMVPSADRTVVALPSGLGITGAAFVDDDTVALAQAVGTSTEVRRWSLRSTGGNEQASPRLFTVPDRVESLLADRHGTRLLALTVHGVLYEGGPGDVPTQRANGISAAAWLGSGP